MAEVASDLIANIEGYQQLLTTLSLGISAGAFALIVQILFHNTSNSNRVNLCWKWGLVAGVGIHLFSVLAGIATKSALVSSVPALHKIEWGGSSAATYLQAAGLEHISYFAIGQIVLFAVGTAVLFAVLIRNVRLL
ncbi:MULTISPECIES: hypothetical protein [unclassified Rhizobium]|uniref:hypothetical protein n=1 Tax=unclassified Rhizobium TaxID=2613769 RepID=UPI0007EC2595|nr:MULTISPECIES: hypothetical protein [unclassified Rhizobium]ANK91537.1 hypothetical protein AMK01_CH02078 [Rhizobium sp. N6212]ANK97570.1 hypothetical protein AMK00_CH02080 [Rhizobium sp. N621]